MENEAVNVIDSISHEDVEVDKNTKYEAELSFKKGRAEISKLSPSGMKPLTFPKPRLERELKPKRAPEVEVGGFKIPWVLVGGAVIVIAIVGGVLAYLRG